jgi:DNA-binding NtrC family response regulator
MQPLAREHLREFNALTQALLAVRAWRGDVLLSRAMNAQLDHLHDLFTERALTAGRAATRIEPPQIAAPVRPRWPYVDQPSLIPNPIPDAPSVAITLRAAREAWEIDWLTKKLAENSGNTSRTAAKIGMERCALMRKLKNLGIARRPYRRKGTS